MAARDELRLAVADLYLSADLLATANQRFDGGLYIAPELRRKGASDKDAEWIAGNVVLSLAYIALGRVS